MTFKHLTDMGDYLMETAFTAGVDILKHYAGNIDVQTKDDKSPVTAADKAAEKIILEKLSSQYPDIPIISEEAASEGHLPEIDHIFFLVDPLDGTREFIKKNGEFTVNIALIHHRLPIAGIVYAPALKTAYYGEKNNGAWSIVFDSHDDISSHTISTITSTPMPESELRMVGSRSHSDPQIDAFIKKHKIGTEKPMGSSLKFCVIADGLADIYPRFGRTMEWDTAAGQAVLTAAGGSVTELDEITPLEYGKIERGYDNPGFIAFGAK